MTHSIQRIPFLSQIEDMEAYVSQYKDMKNNNNTNMIMNLNNASNNYNYNNLSNNNGSSYGSNQNHINNPSSSVMHTVQSYNNIHHNQQNNKNGRHHNHHNYHNHHSTDNNNNSNNNNNNHYQNGYKGFSTNHKNNNVNGGMSGGNGTSMQSYGSQLQVQRSGGVLNPTSYSSLYLNNDMASAPNYLNVPAHFANGIYNGSALDLDSVTATTTPSHPTSATPLYQNTNGYDQLLNQRSKLVSPALSTSDSLITPQSQVSRGQPSYINDFYQTQSETGLGQSNSLYSLQNSMQPNAFDSTKNMVNSTNNNNNNNNNNSNNNMMNESTQGTASSNLGKMSGLYSMNSASPFGSSGATFNDTGLYAGNQSSSPFSYTQHMGASSTAGITVNGSSSSNGQRMPLQQFEQLQTLQSMNQPQQQSHQTSGQQQFLPQQPNLQPFSSAGSSSSGQLNNSSMLSPYNKIWSDNMSVWS
ncbi:hypothetical protein ACO0QE_004234 [Hanseniaspora vineae]